jgi:hypothetical protein
MKRTLYASLAILALMLANAVCTVARGPDTSTVSIDEIKSSVADSLDLGNSNVEQTAVTIAKDYPGEYNINQVSEIFKTFAKVGSTSPIPAIKTNTRMPTAPCKTAR